MIEGSRSGFIPLTNGSGSGGPKNMWIRWIRIQIRSRNTGCSCNNNSEYSCPAWWCPWVSGWCACCRACWTPRSRTPARTPPAPRSAPGHPAPASSGKCLSLETKKIHEKQLIFSHKYKAPGPPAPVYWNFNNATFFTAGLRIRIHLIRIRIQHFRLNTDLDPDPIRIQDFGSKTTIYLFRGLHKGRPSYKRSLQLSKAALWNRNYYLQFRFRLLKSYGSGSGSYFRKVTVPVPSPFLEHKKQI